MKNIFNKLLLALVFMVGYNLQLNAQALVQFIHNSPDPDAKTVDIYFNDTKYKDNIQFRQAGNFSTVIGNLTVKVADPTSTGPNDKILATFDMGRLDAGKGYVLLGNGVLGQNYEKGDASYDIGFKIIKTDIGTPFQADNQNAAEIFVAHGSTDAPWVNLYEESSTTPLIRNLAYNSVSPKLALEPKSYILNLTPANDPSNVVASYVAPLSTAKGFKAFVFASGFLTPNNEPAGRENNFGLFVALPDGSIIELPSNTGNAYVQVIHNAADPAGAMVDVYVNGQLSPELNDFKFRDATSFLEIPAGLPVVVSINAPTSVAVTDGVINSFNLGVLEKDTKYFVVANGVVGNTFETPNDRNITLNLYPQVAGLNTDVVTGVDLFTFHGVTDAPAVDVYAGTVESLGKGSLAPESRIVTNLDYANFATKVNVPAGAYGLTLTPANTPETVVNYYTADISGLAGKQALVVASGFLSPDNEGVENASSFELLAVLEDGTVLTLPVFTPENNETAFVQVIHNSSDPAAATVDIYVNDAKLDALDDFAYRAATPFVELPANEDIIIKIAAPTSENADDQIITTINLGKLTTGSKYYVVANGVVATGFETPEGRDIGFQLLVKELDKTEILDGGIRLNVLHGATDAPAVDVLVNQHTGIVNDLDYAEFSDFLNVPLTDYFVYVNVANTSTTAKRYLAPLSILKDQLATAGINFNQALIFASGFLDPSNEGISEELYEDYSFGLYAVIPEGAVVRLLDLTNTSFVNLIHNSPDPLLETVDVYVNGEKFEETEDFKYLTATGNLLLPSGVPLNISVNAGDSENADDKVLKVFENVTFEPITDYAVIANGVATPNFTNPFERDITPTLSVSKINLFSPNTNQFEFLTFHGVTDAPAVDIYVNGEIKAVDNLDFREFSAPNSLPAGNYEVGIRVAGGDADVITYGLGLPEQLLGTTGVVFASGFLSADDEGLTNTDGRTFSVNVALLDGTVIPLPVISSVRDFVINENIFSIYPNPSAEIINLNLESVELSTINSIQIYNINGEVVRNLETGYTNQINVGDLNNGAYFIRLDADNKSYISKFNVKR